MAHDDHAQESRWEQWSAAEACTWLVGQRCPYVDPRAGRTALPETFFTWLLDRNRWGREGYGDVWDAEGDPRAAEFIRRSVETWPDEELFCALKRLGEDVPLRERTALDPEERIMDLLAWWIIFSRGLVPSDFTPGNPRRQVYGDIVTTHIGKAVYSGLLKKNPRFVYVSGPIRPARAEAYRTVFDTCLEHTLDHLCGTGHKAVDICRRYQPGAGDAWGFLHRCIENDISDFLDSKDREVNVPTIVMADRFRRICDAAARQVNPFSDGPPGAESLAPDEQMDHATWRELASQDPGAQEEPDDPEATVPRHSLLSGAQPVAQATLLLKYTPPLDWANVLAGTIAADLGLADRNQDRFVELTQARCQRFELTLLRRDACFEKREYLRLLKERTTGGLRKVLSEEGHSRDQIRRRIDLLEEQVAKSEVLLGEVRAVQRNKACPVGSQAYLAARLQELVLCEEKMSRYAAEYETQWEDRYVLTAEELKTLAEVFATTPQNVKQQLIQLEEALELL